MALLLEANACSTAWGDQARIGNSLRGFAVWTDKPPTLPGDVDGAPIPDANGNTLALGFSLEGDSPDTDFGLANRKTIEILTNNKADTSITRTRLFIAVDTISLPKPF